MSGIKNSQTFPCGVPNRQSPQGLWSSALAPQLSLGSQPGSLILAFLLGNLMTLEQRPTNLPSPGAASLRRVVPPQVWWQSSRMLEETPCARAGLEEVDTKSPARLQGLISELTFDIVGLILEEKP